MRQIQYPARTELNRLVDYALFRHVSLFSKHDWSKEIGQIVLLQPPHVRAILATLTSEDTLAIRPLKWMERKRAAS